jgi:hypothetical protein
MEALQHQHLTHEYRMNRDYPHRPSALRFCRITAWLCLALALAVTGCRSLSGPGSASFASVTIQNHSSEEIAAMTAKVFESDGYRGRISGPGELTFEKEASRATTLSREGVVATQAGAQTINRVRVKLVPLSDGAWRLQCKAFMVSGGGDGFMQDEVPLANIRSGPYQSMLNRVKKELN